MSEQATSEIPPNADNERIKARYFWHLRQGDGRDEKSIDIVAASLARFERWTGAKCFKTFDKGQAVGFKEELRQAVNARTGKPLGKPALSRIVRDLRTFFVWLERQHGYRSHVSADDAKYFKLTRKELEIAGARRPKRLPALDDMKRALRAMPASTAIERRDRAVFAFAMITAARAGAMASFRLRHVHLDDGYVLHDGRDVRTKFGKTFPTYFVPFDELTMSIVTEWVRELGEIGRGPDDFLFPATETRIAASGAFAPTALSTRGWGSTGPIREVFRRAYAAAGLPYTNPHATRDVIVHHAMSMNLSPAAMKALSQNLGHADVLTTFTSYGELPQHVQRDLIRDLGKKDVSGHDVADIKEAVKAALTELGVAGRMME